MPAKLLEDALGAWREGERLLGSLPAVSPDHESIRLVIIELRDAYRQVSATSAVTEDVLVANRETVAEARRVIREVEARMRKASTDPTAAG